MSTLSDLQAWLWLISILFLLYFYVKLGKSKPLDSEERLLAWTGVILFILSVSLQSVEWLGITPAFLIPYTSNLVYLMVLVGAIVIALFVGRRTKRSQTMRGTDTTHEATQPASPRLVESGTLITPKSSEPIIVTSKLLAGVDFYPSRGELPSLERLLGSAKTEVYLLGFSLETVGTQNRDTIRSLLLSGVRIVFIVLAPTSPLVNPVEQAFSAASITKAIDRVVDELNNIRSGLPKRHQNLLEIRTHDLVPIHNIIAIDPSSDKAVIRVESYLYGESSRSWVTLEVKKSENLTLFTKYWNSYKFVLDRSKLLSI